MKGRSSVVFVFCFVYFLVGFAAADVLLKGRNFSSLYFVGAELNKLGGKVVCGVMYAAEPFDACTQLTNKVANDSSSPIALIVRGGCSFDEKAQNALIAGFKAVVFYDSKDDYHYFLANFFAVPETSVRTEIVSIFVFKESGEFLKEYAGDTDKACCVETTPEIFDVLPMVFCIISMGYIFTLGCCYAATVASLFIHAVWTRLRQFFYHPLPVSSVMSGQRVKSMAISTFNSASDDNSTSTTCAICLDDYDVGEKLKALPCCHKFHAVCVDLWLTEWRSFCPICKVDVETRTKNPPPSENTPLLSASVASPQSSSLPSFHPSVTGSLPIQIVPPPRLPSSSRIHSLSSLNAANSYLSFSNPHSSIIFRSLPNLRHASSENSDLPYLVHDCRDNNAKVRSKTLVSSSL